MTKTITIYGIKNCDTMKKARAWLDDHGVAYAFHDYKMLGIQRAKLEGWAAKDGVNLADYPKLADHYKRMGERPAVKAALAKHG